jgi:hypothetical protein
MSDINKVKNDLWEATNKLLGESNLKTSEFSVPVLGLIFLRFADFNFSNHKKGKFVDSELGNLNYKTPSQIYYNDDKRRKRFRF